ncbi:MAG: S8 family serine peptidase, partial [Candidatus Anstonellales archaeon]
MIMNRVGYLFLVLITLITLYLTSFNYISNIGLFILQSKSKESIETAHEVEILNLSKILKNKEFSYEKYTIKPKIQNESLSIILKDKTNSFFSRYKINRIQNGFFTLFDSEGNKKKYYLNVDTNLSLINLEEKSYIIKFKDPPLAIKKEELKKEVNEEIEKIKRNVSLKFLNKKDADKKIKFLENEMEKKLEYHKEKIKFVHDLLKIKLNITATNRKNIKEFKNVYNGISLRLSKNDLDKIRNITDIERIYEDDKVQLFLNDSVRQINATEVWEMLDENGINVTGFNITIAIIDTGIDYSHPEFGGCSALGVVYSPNQPEDYVIESPHPYTNGYDKIWTIQREGFTQISVHFVNISVEPGWDYVTILDSNNNTIATYTGSKYDFWTPPIQGNTISIKLTSDYSITDYGFYLDKIANGTTVITSSCKVIGGYDFVNHDSDPMDDHGHGTHVAGIAAGNSSLKGVAPNAKLLAYKVLDSWGYGYESDVISAIEKAIDDSADIISISLGKDTGTPDDPLSEAVDNAVNSNVVVVVSAGNEGPGYGTIATPANARRAITVGAVDKINSIADFSSRGPVIWNATAIIKPDVVAPGVDICSAEYGSFFASHRCIDNRHVSLSGTSMAAPHVTGAVALLKQYHKNWTSDEIKSAIILASTDLGYDAVTQGSGLINIFKAINISILIDPVVINTNFVGNVYPVNSTIIKIKNQRPYQISVNLTVENATNEYGESYNISFLNATSITIEAGSESAVLLTFNMTDKGGVLFGKIKFTTEEKNYTVPYIVSWLKRLNVS